MWGIPVAFIAGYAVARWFGEAIKNVVKAAYDEIEAVIEDWF